MLPNRTPETHRRRKHWLEIMLSSIKDRSGFRFEICETFSLIRPFVTIFFRLSVKFRSIRLSASCTVPVLHVQAWYELSRYQATAYPCVTSRGPGVVPFTRGVTFYGHRNTLWFSWTQNLSCRSAPRRIFYLGLCLN